MKQNKEEKKNEMKANKKCIEFIQELFDLIEPNGQSNSELDYYYNKLNKIKELN